MSEIRMLSTDEIDAFIDITTNAYPGWEPMGTEEGRERIRQQLTRLHEEVPTKALHGLFREGQMMGGMLFHDFTLNFLGVRILSGGIGIVAVEFLHKKEHVAKEMIAYFLRHYRERGGLMAMLYPFRPDFYEKMGFGWGTKMNQYRVLPAALPRGPSKAHVRYLGEDDVLALLGCYNRFVSRTHGMIERYEPEVAQMLKNAQLRVAGYVRDDQILGYLVFNFEKGESFIVNDLVVRELVYESREALWELLTFLHTQADQIRRIVFNTQDEFFHYLLRDPRNGTPKMIPSVFHESNVQGVGLMYRVLDTRGILETLSERDFCAQTCRIKLSVKDSFLPENDGDTFVHLQDGRLRLSPKGGGAYDVAVRLNVAQFSSLLAGAVNFRSLYRYGLADISDAAYIDVVDRAFAVDEKPICMTAF